MRKCGSLVLVLGTAFLLLMPGVAQAEVVISNNSSTQSTSTASSPGHHATTTTSGTGSTDIAVDSGFESLDVNSRGSSETKAAAGPGGATASGNSTNESDIDLDCGQFGCGAAVDCVDTTCKCTHNNCKQVVFHHGHHKTPVFVPVPHHPVIVPLPANQTVVGRDLNQTVAGRDIGDCDALIGCRVLSDLGLDLNLLNGLGLGLGLLGDGTGTGGGLLDLGDTGAVGGATGLIGGVVGTLFA